MTSCSAGAFPIDSTRDPKTADCSSQSTRLVRESFAPRRQIQASHYNIMDRIIDIMDRIIDLTSTGRVG